MAYDNSNFPRRAAPGRIAISFHSPVAQRGRVLRKGFRAGKAGGGRVFALVVKLARNTLTRRVRRASFDHWSALVGTGRPWFVRGQSRANMCQLMGLEGI
ncbi:hypothetical protein SAMN04488527_14511 [Aliiroseovarius crassostreae]|nr:hypothetical protein SAMN04488527_14511 [Aliiroseovarius crassostreae]